MNENNYFSVKSNSTGYYKFNAIPVGNYLLQTGLSDYRTLNKALTLVNNTALNLALEPDVRTPIKLMASDSANQIKLKWLPKTLDILDTLPKDNNTEITKWSVNDANNDGNKWNYDSINFKFYEDKIFRRVMAITSHSPMNDDWLVSPALQVSGKSKLTFVAQSYDKYKYNDKLFVRISTTGGQLADFDLDSMLAQYKFKYGRTWQNFEINLGKYSGFDSVWIAIQCASEAQEKLAIANVGISYLATAPKGMENDVMKQNSVLDKYIVYRSANNKDYTQIAEITDKSTKYNDSTTIAGKDYWYAVKSVYNIGTTDFSEPVKTKITNFPPVITKINDASIDEDKSVKILINYTDDNGMANHKILTAISNPNLTLKLVNNEMTITPFPNWNGSATVRVQVTDGFLTDSVSFALTVKPVNDLPVISSVAKKEAKIDMEYVYIVSAVDIDGDSLFFKAEKLPSWLTFHFEAGDNFAILRGTPKSKTDQTEVSISVTDKFSTPRLQTFTIKILDSNVAPIFTSTALTSATVGILYSYKVTVFDANSDVLIITVNNLPAWLSFNAATNVLSGTPPAGLAGDYIVTFIVTDIYGASAKQEFTIHINSINYLPVFTTNPKLKAYIENTYLYYFSASDADKNKLTYTTSKLPAWLNFIPENNLLTGTPEKKDIGKYQITLKVNDGVDTTQVLQTFTIEVFEFITATAEMTDKEEITIFPNPSNGIIYLSSQSKHQTADIKAFDMSGKMVYQKRFDLSIGNQIIDLQTLSNGVYNLQISSEKTVFTKKLILQK